jgi:hypothetical protein
MITSRPRTRSHEWLGHGTSYNRRTSSRIRAVLISPRTHRAVTACTSAPTPSDRRCQCYLGQPSPAAFAGTSKLTDTNRRGPRLQISLFHPHATDTHCVASNPG